MMVKWLLALAVCLVINPVCGERFRDDLEGDCIPTVERAPKGFSFYPDEYKLEGEDGLPAVEVEVAEDFRVEYGPNFKVVTNLRVGETYVLYQCGTTPPTDTKIPKSAKLFEIPLTSVAVADTTIIGFMDALGVSDRVSHASQYASSPCYQVLASEPCNKVAHDPGSQFADQDMVEAQEDFVDSIIASTASDHPKTITFTATADPSVLKRAEWIKFVACFFNKEVEANRIYDGVKSVWNSLQKDKSTDGPTIAWFSYSDYAGPQYVLHFAPYKVDYIQAAGGRTLDEKLIAAADGWKKTATGYESVDIDVARKGLMKILKTADMIIDETYAPNNSKYTLQTFKSKAGIKRGTYRFFPFLVKEQVFRLDGRISPGASDGLEWFEGPVARPDLVLLDILSAVGSDKSKGHERMWLRNIATGESVNEVSSEDCGQDPDMCVFSPKVICPAAIATCSGSLKIRSTNATSCPRPACGKD